MPKFLEVTNPLAARAVIGTQTLPNLSTLKATTSVSSALADNGFVLLLGYYSPGDGGGGLFRWDSTDTSSADNGGTVIVPTDSGLAASGRWKRVYEGDVNARWFGVNPSRVDNTAALQSAINWVCGLAGGGTVYIPAGEYPFTFGAGTSGLDTITIDAWGVTIRGDGTNTRLKVTNNAAPNQVDYFFTFSYNDGEFAANGGVHDLTFDGNSMLKWCIGMHSWQNFKVERVLVLDVHSGGLDAVNHSSIYYPNQVIVRDLDHGQPDGAVSQYLVRFRLHDATAKPWTDCYIYNVGGNGIWDSGIVLDCCQRFQVRECFIAHSGVDATNTLDGVARTGVKHAVAVTHSLSTGGEVGGDHIIDGIYLEETSGTSTSSTNVAVLIDHPGAGVNTQIQRVRVSDVAVSALCGMLKVVDPVGRVIDTRFKGNRSAADSSKFTIAAATTGTVIDLDPNSTVINAPGATPTVPVEYEEVSYTGIAAAITSLSTGLTFTPANGRRLRLRFKDNGTARAITAGAKFRAVGVTLPTTTTISKTMYWDCVYNEADAVWDVVDVGEDGDVKVTAKNTATLTAKTLTDPKINAIKDTNGNTSVQLNAVNSAINYFTLTNAASGGVPVLSVDGSTNLPIFIQPKGDAATYFLNAAGSATAVISSPTTSGTTNYLGVQSATAGNPVVVSAIGEASATLNLVCGASGTVQANGVPVSTRLTNTATLDFGSVTAGSYAEQSITVTGAAVGDAVALGYPAVTDGIVYSAYVSATNTVKVVAHNHSASALDPASGTFRVTIIR